MLFNEMLMKRRKELGMTQDDLAEKLSVSRQSVSRWENGECMPDSEKLLRLSDVLGISLDELTGREVKIEPIILEAPKLPKAKKPSFLRVLIAAAVCLVIGAAGFLLGRYILPHINTDTLSEKASKALTVEDFSMGYYSADGEYSLIFTSNAVDNGVIRFYPSNSNAEAVSAKTISCGNGVYVADVMLELGARYDKAVFTANTSEGEQSTVFLSQILVCNDGGISYNDHTTFSSAKSTSVEYHGSVIPENGIIVGFDDSDNSKCSIELLETITYSDEDYIVPFDRDKTLNEMYAHVRTTYTDLSEEDAMKLAIQITDRIEMINKALCENDAEGLDYTLTEDGSKIYNIGRVVDDVLEVDGT